MHVRVSLYFFDARYENMLREQNQALERRFRGEITELQRRLQK
jgi:hypothetical protein